MTPLEIAEQNGISLAEITKIINNALSSVKKAYSFTGSLTDEDLIHTGWIGVISALNQDKFTNCVNKCAYIYVFARGYMTHDLHRKSRVVRVPWALLKDKASGYGHLSYSWDNLPEPIAAPTTTPVAVLELLEKIPASEKTKILNGKPVKESTNKIISEIRSYETSFSFN